MQPLSQAQVGSACSEWLQALSTELALLRESVLGACSDAAGLADLEAAVREGLSHWKAESESGATAAPGGIQGSRSRVRADHPSSSTSLMLILPCVWSGPG